MPLFSSAAGVGAVVAVLRTLLVAPRPRLGHAGEAIHVGADGREGALSSRPPHAEDLGRDHAEGAEGRGEGAEDVAARPLAQTAARLVPAPLEAPYRAMA